MLVLKRYFKSVALLWGAAEFKYAVCIFVPTRNIYAVPVDKFVGGIFDYITDINSSDSIISNAGD